MKLSKIVIKVCTIVVPWGLYEYVSMSMGIFMASYVFQARIAGLFSYMVHVLVYTNNISIIGYSTHDAHLKDVQEVL